MITLFETEEHKNIMFNDLGSGKMIQANQHFIIDANEGMVLDPGGHKVHTQLFAEMTSILPVSQLKYIFLSHQDPDIIAAVNAWLMMTDAQAFMPSIWIRFATHFGIDELAEKRITLISDEGQTLPMGNVVFKILPAHYLHSSGNLHLYDPVAKILYTGDIGASPAAPYPFVEDFDAHIKYMEGFHIRYMPATKALKMWLKMVRSLEIDIIAPQHGAVINDKSHIVRFFDWLDSIEVGVDKMGDAYAIPE